MRYINIITIITSLLLITSCFKEDEMITPHVPGNVKTQVIPLTYYYTNQVYFDFETSTIVSTNTKSSHDLNFSSSDTSLIIRLNTANFAFAAETDYENLSQKIDTTGLIWKFDPSSGNTDSTALSEWISFTDIDTTYSNKVWLINRGIDALGLPLGIIKIKFEKYLNNSFYFSWANLNDENIISTIVTTKNDYNYTQFSFDNNAITQSEPQSNTWDLVFSQYTTLLFTDENTPYPYLVTGVLLNSNAIAAIDTALTFDDIVLSDTIFMDFSAKADKIGYQWKKVVGDVSSGSVTYDIRYNYNYIISTSSGYFYKMRFIDFYDPETGDKGYPTFEYQQL